MKRFIIFLSIIMALTVITGCTAKAEEEVNAVVYEFWTQWRTENEVKLASLMTAEVEFGAFAGEDLDATPKTALPREGVPASFLADALINGYSVADMSQDAFKITNTAIYKEYAVVDSLFVIPEEPDEEIKMLFHLVDTDEGWKVSLVGLKIATLKTALSSHRF